MSEEKIETKKKDKSVWKNLGVAAVAIGGIAIKLANILKKNIKSNISK